MRHSSLKERLRLLTEELKANPEYQKDLLKLQKKLRSKSLDIEQFANDGFVKAFIAKNNFFLKWELKDWVCGEPILHGLELEYDGVRKGALLYLPSWAQLGDIRDCIPRLKKFKKGMKLGWGSLKGNTVLARLERNREIRKMYKTLRKKKIKSFPAIEIIINKIPRSYDTIRQIVHNPKFDK